MASEERAAAGYERLTYKHGVYALGFILSKHVEATLSGAVLIEPGNIDSALSIAFDGARHALWNAVDARAQAAYKGPLAIVRNIGEALPVLITAMTVHYGLTADPVLARKAVSKGGEPYPVALFDYLASKAQPIGGLT